jgi:hypothetical protein
MTTPAKKPKKTNFFLLSKQKIKSFLGQVFKLNSGWKRNALTHSAKPNVREETGRE